MNILEKYPRLKMNGVYKHFKGSIGGNSMLYLVSALATRLPRNLRKEDLEELTFIREDIREEIKVYRLGYNYFYTEDDMEGTYVLYTALYGNRLTYLRNIDVFFSTVESGNRFDLVGELSIY